MFLFLGLSAGWSVVGCAAIESLDTTSESFNAVRLSGRSNRLSPLCNSESGLIRNESFNKESPGNTIFFNESVASESVPRLSFGAAIVSVASGVFLGGRLRTFYLELYRNRIFAAYSHAVFTGRYPIGHITYCSQGSRVHISSQTTYNRR